MILKILKFFLIIIFIFWVNFFLFTNFFKEYYPDGNIVSIEKKEKLVSDLVLFQDEKPDKIISKGIFVKKNLILTVAHWIWSKNDVYNIFTNESKKPKKANLIFKDEKKDVALLKANDKFFSFLSVDFWDISKNEIYFFKDWKIEKRKIKKMDQEKIFIEEEFFPGDSGTIFFNEKKEIIWILTEYDLKNKLAIINILKKDFLQEILK